MSFKFFKKNNKNNRSITLDSIESSNNRLSTLERIDNLFKNADFSYKLTNLIQTDSKENEFSDIKSLKTIFKDYDITSNDFVLSKNNKDYNSLINSLQLSVNDKNTLNKVNVNFNKTISFRVNKLCEVRNFYDISKTLLLYPNDYIKLFKNNELFKQFLFKLDRTRAKKAYRLFYEINELKKDNKATDFVFLFKLTYQINPYLDLIYNKHFVSSFNSICVDNLLSLPLINNEVHQMLKYKLVSYFFQVSKLNNMNNFYIEFYKEIEDNYYLNNKFYYYKFILTAKYFEKIFLFAKETKDISFEKSDSLLEIKNKEEVLDNLLLKINFNLSDHEKNYLLNENKLYGTSINETHKDILDSKLNKSLLSSTSTKSTYGTNILTNNLKVSPTFYFYGNLYSSLKEFYLVNYDSYKQKLINITRKEKYYIKAYLYNLNREDIIASLTNILDILETYNKKVEKELIIDKKNLFIDTKK